MSQCVESSVEVVYDRVFFWVPVPLFKHLEIPEHENGGLGLREFAACRRYLRDASCCVGERLI
jgi:hypothetical protein